MKTTNLKTSIFFNNFYCINPKIKYKFIKVILKNIVLNQISIVPSLSHVRDITCIGISKNYILLRYLSI